MDYKTGIATIAAALALYASAGCKKDEPIVVRPRVSCCHNDCNSHSHDMDGNYTVKPAHNLEPKYGNRTRPELSRHNPFNDSDARERAERLINGRRGTPQLSGHNPFNEPGRPRVQYGAGASGSTSGSSSGSQRSQELMPNPYTGCSGSSAGSANADPCYDTSRTLQERGRACAERLPTADEAFGPGEDTSLEQRLRDCEEQNAEIRQLNGELEEQLNDAMVPDHGRG